MDRGVTKSNFMHTSFWHKSCVSQTEEGFGIDIVSGITCSKDKFGSICLLYYCVQCESFFLSTFRLQMNTLDSSTYTRILIQKNADLNLIGILPLNKVLTFLIDGILLLSFKGAAQRNYLVLCILHAFLGGEK